MHDWHYFFNHLPYNLDAGTYRIFEPQWKAEILDWVGREDVAAEQKEEFIKALVDFDDNCGNYYRYRAYFLASEAIAQFNDCSLADAIVEQLLKWSYAYFRQDKRDWKVYPEPLVNKARVALEATDRERVIAAFVQLVHTTESRTILQLAAQKLGQLNPGNKTAIAALVQLLQVIKDKVKLYEVIHSLEELDGNETAITILVQLLQKAKAAEDIEEPYILNTFYFLKRIGYGNQMAIDGLIQVIEITLNKVICEEAIVALGNIGYGNEMAITAFVKFLQKNQGDNICFAAAKALWQINPGNITTINALVHILETNQSGFIPGDAAEFLAEIDTDNIPVAITAMPLVITTLVQLLKPTQHEWIHLQAVRALAEISTNNQMVLAKLNEVIAAISHLLRNTQNEPTQRNAVWALGKIGVGNKTAIAAISELLGTTQDAWTSLEAAKNLLLIDPSNEIALVTLSQLLEKAEDKWIRLQVAEKLLQIDDKHQKAIDTLCELFYTEILPGWLPPENSALSIMESIDPSHQLAIKALVQLTNTAWDQDALIYAAENLERLDPGNSIAQEKLNKLIAAVLQCMQTFPEDDDGYLLNIGIFSRGILQSDSMPQAVIALKPYLSEQFCRRTPLNYDLAYGIIWDCAQKMSYPDFYKAWYT